MLFMLNPFDLLLPFSSINTLCGYVRTDVFRLGLSRWSRVTSPFHVPKPKPQFSNPFSRQDAYSQVSGDHGMDILGTSFLPTTPFMFALFSQRHVPPVFSVGYRIKILASLYSFVKLGWLKSLNVKLLPLLTLVWILMTERGMGKWT